MEAQSESQRLTVGRLVIVLLSRTTLNTAYRIVYPFLPSIARGLGISLQAATALTSLRLFAGMAAPILGPLAEQYGRRRSMELGLVFLSCAGLLLAATGTFAFAAVAFVLFGLAKAIFDPAVYAYIGDAVPYHRRGRVVGIVELSWSLAWLIGVPISGFLIENLSWRAPWALLGLLGACAVLLTHFGLPAGPRRSKNSFSSGVDGSNDWWAGLGAAALVLTRSTLATWKTLLRQRTVVAILLTGFLLSAAIEVPFIVYGAWLELAFGLSLSALGLASIVVGLAEATAEMGTSLLSDRLGKRQSVIMGLVGLAGSLLLLPALSSHGLLAALVGVALMILAFEFALVSLLPITTEVVPGARASVLGLNITAQSLGHALGALAGGWLWRWENIAVQGAVGAACALLAVLVLLRGVQDGA